MLHGINGWGHTLLCVHIILKGSIGRFTKFDNVLNPNRIQASKTDCLNLKQARWVQGTCYTSIFVSLPVLACEITYSSCICFFASNQRFGCYWLKRLVQVTSSSPVFFDVGHITLQTAEELYVVMPGDKIPGPESKLPGRAGG